MGSPVVPHAALRTLIGYWTATGNYFAGAKCHLYQNNVSLTPQTKLADLVEATFDGYVASATIVWGTPYSDVMGNAVVLGGLQQFESTGSTTPNIIYGAFLADSTGAILLAAVAFPSPQTIAQAGDAVIYIPEISLGQPPV